VCDAGVSEFWVSFEVDVFKLRHVGQDGEVVVLDIAVTQVE
jgi:hypothetical protein